jgi:low affinity Fe/Cu permease
MLALKVKELNEMIRIKHLEVDEERKMRTKAEQRAEDEKDKNKQFINFSKEN